MWISVKDRLPEQYDTVIVFPDSLGGVEIADYVGAGISGEHTWYESIGEDRDQIYPTHWQPLPSPPEVAK